MTVPTMCAAMGRGGMWTSPTMTSLFSLLVRPRVSTIQTSSLALALYLRLSFGLPVSSAYVRISSVFTPNKISCEKGHWIFRPGMYHDEWDVVFTRSRFPRGKSHVVSTRCCFSPCPLSSGRVNFGMRAPGSALVDAPGSAQGVRASGRARVRASGRATGRASGRAVASAPVDASISASSISVVRTAMGHRRHRHWARGRHRHSAKTVHNIKPPMHGLYNALATSIGLSKTVISQKGIVH